MIAASENIFPIQAILFAFLSYIHTDHKSSPSVEKIFINAWYNHIQLAADLKTSISGLCT